MLPGHRPHVERQPARQAQAGQRRLEEHLGEVGRIFERQQRHRIEAVEHLPAGVIEAADAGGLVGETRGQSSDEAVVIAVHGDVEPPRHVVLELGLIGDGLAVLAHIREGTGKQVGVSLLPETEDHRRTHIEGVTVAAERSTTATGDQIALQHQGASPLGGQLTGGHQTTDAGADHHGIPLLLIAHGFGSIGGDAKGPPAAADQPDESVVSP